MKRYISSEIGLGRDVVDDRMAETPEDAATTAPTDCSQACSSRSPSSNVWSDPMAERTGWINAAMRTARAGRDRIGLKTYTGMCEAVLFEAMRREEYQVAAEYRQVVETLRG